MEAPREISLPILIVLFVFTMLIITDASTVLVESHAGKIQGAKKADRETGVSCVSFKGIPYAKPPVGDLRFAKPQPLPVLDEVFDAAQDNIILCPRPDLMTLGQTGFTEDCLVLYIQSREISPSEGSLKKVLVFFHGGGFVIGGAYIYDATSFVISQDVIVVTVNYRLGVLGFLSIENEASPGNFGLWDQTLSLKWVKDNIRAFGGDPDDVTIAGESAGGSSVGYQMITPHAKGLFTRASPQSGTATTVFGRSINAQSHALEFAKTVGCWEKATDYQINVDESNVVMKCLRNVPLSSITSYSYGGMPTFNLQFLPVVDNDFIPDLPSKLINDDVYLNNIGFFDKTYLITITNNELGVMDALLQPSKASIFMNNKTTDEEKEKAWQEFQEDTNKLYILSRLGETGSSNDAVVERIDNFYKRRGLNDKIFIEMVTDLSYLIPSYDFLLAASRHKSCSAYFLHFDHYPQYVKGSYKGTPHAIDLSYWFDIGPLEMEKILNVGIKEGFASDDVELKRLFSSVVGQFVRTGEPGGALKESLPSGWPKYDKVYSYYLNFNLKPWVSNFLEKDKFDLWFETVPSMLKGKQRHTEL